MVLGNWKAAAEEQKMRWSPNRSRQPTPVERQACFRTPLARRGCAHRRAYANSMRVLFLLLALTATLGGCKRRGSALSAGTWKCDLDYPSGGHFQSTMILDSGGRYVCNGSVTTSNGVRAFTIEGTMKIDGAFIVDTMTKHSNTNASLPSTSRAKIIRQSDREIVAKWEGAEAASTMRKLR